MGFPMKECWSGLLVPAPGDFSNTGIEPVSPAWQVDSLPLSHLGRSLRWRSYALSTSYYVIIFQCLEQYLTHRKCSINVSNYSYFSHTFVEKQNEWIKCLLKNLNISEWFPHGSPQSSFFSQGRFFFFFQFRMCYTSLTIVTTIIPFWCWKIVILTAFSMTSAQSLWLHVLGLFGGCVIVYLPWLMVFACL